MINPEKKLKIALASDLHMEFRRDFALSQFQFPRDSDVIVLAGDLNVGHRAADTVRGIAEANPDAEVLWVAGNHEFYKVNIDQQLEAYRQACADLPNIHFLENDRIALNGVTFLGCTLWTDFTILGESRQPDAMDAVRDMLNDFVLIEMGEGEIFTPEAACERFQQSYAFLKAELQSADPERTVVISHFCPGLETHNSNFPLDLAATYFQANVVPLIERFEPALWIYGHNHFNDDLSIGKTRVVSNQLGYPGEDCGGVFDLTKLIEI